MPSMTMRYLEVYGDIAPTPPAPPTPVVPGAPVITNVINGEPLIVEFVKVSSSPPVTEYVCVAQKGSIVSEFTVVSTKPAAIPVSGYVTGDVVTFTVYAVNSNGRSVGSNQQTVTVA